MNYSKYYNKFLIFDGSHCLHRNISQPNNWEMKTSTGTRTGGLLGTLRSIAKESNDYNYFPIVVFDSRTFS